MLETLDYTIRIGSTPTFLYFDLYSTLRLYSTEVQITFTVPPRFHCHYREYE